MPVAASQTLREGRQAYFAENGLPADGGYQDRWVVIKLGGIPVFAFPNTKDRRRAVPFHDLHHVLTGYGTDLRGEAEIGACDDDLLERRVGEMRRELGVDRPPGTIGRRDRAAFRRWAAVAVGLAWGPLLPMVAIAGWLVTR